MNEITYRWELTLNPKRLREYLKKRIAKKKDKNIIRDKQSQCDWKFIPNEKQRWV